MYLIIHTRCSTFNYSVYIGPHMTLYSSKRSDTILGVIIINFYMDATVVSLYISNVLSQQSPYIDKICNPLPLTLILQH